MTKIAGVGACVLDTLISLSTYPKEDTKNAAISTRLAGGGPVATGLCAAARLGASSAYLGNLAEDEGGLFLKKDFEKWGVETEGISLVSGAASFRSVLWLCRDTGSRTCVYDRGTVPMPCFTEEQKKTIRDASILMVDGNFLDAAVDAAKLARENGTLVLYDAGGRYEGVERLLALTDILIPSREFALGITGAGDEREAAEILCRTYSPKLVVITCGKEGGLWLDGTVCRRYPAFPVEALDSNGAGDVFHGAFAAGWLKGLTPDKCCLFASAVSALKCQGIGARESVPDYETVMEFLKEKGYEL